MKKNLGIIVNEYPYSYAEAFLSDELAELSIHFDHIFLFIPMNNEEILKKHRLFELPANVSVVPINNRFGFFQKIGTVFRIGPFKLFRMLRSESKTIGYSLSFAMFKILFMYLGKEKDFRRKLWNAIRQRSLNEKSLILYSYWFTEYTYALYKLKKQYPQLQVYTRMHGWDVYFERHDPPYLPLRKIILEGLTASFTVAEQAKNYLVKKFSIDGSRIETYRLGVSRFPENEWKNEKNVLRLLSISFILPVKNLELIIDSLAGIDQDVRIYWTHIGGGNEYAQKVMNYAGQKLGPCSNIHVNFSGTLSTKEIKQWIGKNPVDLLINASHDEGVPVSMMEAMSAGIPVIGPDVGGVSEIIVDHKNGFLLSAKPTREDFINTLMIYTKMDDFKVKELRAGAYYTWEQLYNGKVNHHQFALRLTNGS